MCYIALTLCHSCSNNVRQVKPCAAGTTTAGSVSEFRYLTNIPSETTVCARTGDLLPVGFEKGPCEGCIYAEEKARSTLQQWERDLELLSKGTRNVRGSREKSRKNSGYKAKREEEEASRLFLLRMWEKNRRESETLPLGTKIEREIMQRKRMEAARIREREKEKEIKKMKRRSDKETKSGCRERVPPAGGEVELEMQRGPSERSPRRARLPIFVGKFSF